jgi:N utilization substance protein B
MGTRRHSRESAMQALFFMDMNCGFSEQMLANYCRCFSPNKRSYPFFERLTAGVLKLRPEIDRVIERYSSNWKVQRMACVDRNILRVAVYELLYCSDIPSKVSINEAIDIAKKFGASESGAFINGILDSIRMALEAKKLLPVSDPTPIKASPEVTNEL